MPTYDYRCTKCDHRFEAFQSMSDLPLSDCPECNGPVKRVMGGGAGIIFKGSGFYVTDSKKSGSGGTKTKSSPTVKSPSPEAASSTSTSTKTESSSTASA